MKKILSFAFCAVAALSAARAADGVTSENVVGYNTLTPTGKYIMMGGVFTKVGGGSNAVDTIKGSFASGDQIQIANVVGAKIDFDIFNYETIDDDLVDVDGWYNGNGEYVGDSLYLPQGVAVWFVSSDGSAKATTQAGEVPSTSFTKSFTKKYTMCSGAFPVAFNPNDSRFTWTMKSGDQIQVAQVSGGKIDFDIFSYETIDDDLVDVNGWYDGNGTLVSNTIAAAGQGFWVVCQDGTGSVVETSPLAK